MNGCDDDPVKDKVVAILEARAGVHLAELIARRGAVPLPAPALEEVADVDPQLLSQLLSEWRADPFAATIFQTGVGTRALFEAADALRLGGELLDLVAASVVVVRGPKPVGELQARGVAIARRAKSPFTTAAVLDVLDGIDLSGVRVLVQRYGAANLQLCDGLQARGARPLEIATYRWALPADVQPLLDLLAALRAGSVDAVLFTSAVQVQNLHAVAAGAGDAAGLSARLRRCVIGSIGPVCSRALAAIDVPPTFEANPPKLGPLLTALEEALARR